MAWELKQYIVKEFIVAPGGRGQLAYNVCVHSIDIQVQIRKYN